MQKLSTDKIWCYVYNVGNGSVEAEILLNNFMSNLRAVLNRIEFLLSALKNLHFMQLLLILFYIEALELLTRCTNQAKRAARI